MNRKDTMNEIETAYSRNREKGHKPHNIHYVNFFLWGKWPKTVENERNMEKSGFYGKKRDDFSEFHPILAVFLGVFDFRCPVLADIRRKYPVFILL
jgi:hypothetical protein